MFLMEKAEEWKVGMANAQVMVHLETEGIPVGDQLLEVESSIGEWTDNWVRLQGKE